MEAPPFRIVQPYGRDLGNQSTLVSEHSSVAEAFAAPQALPPKIACQQQRRLGDTERLDASHFGPDCPTRLPEVDGSLRIHPDLR